MRNDSNTQASAAGKVNFAGLDAIRAFAALGVVALHSCVPYLQNPMPGLAWPVRDKTSALLDCLFWGIEVFIMPVFLVLAGFLAWRTITRRGPKQLVTGRAKRLLIPLLFGMMVVLPLDLYVWVMAWVGEGIVSPVKLKSLKVEGELGQQLWGLSHLWFLEYLFLYVAIFASSWWLVERRPNLIRRVRWVFHPRFAGVVLMATGILTLCFRPEVVWGFQHAFEPVPSKWLYSGTFFIGGLLLARFDMDLAKLKARSTTLLLPAACLLIAAVGMGRVFLSEASSGGQNSANASILLAIVTTAAAWLVTLAIVGASVRWIRSVPFSVKYLAAASFWVYLVHHPILAMSHTNMKLVLPEMGPIPKAVFAFCFSVTLSLIIFEFLVRESTLGRWLGFAWQADSPQQPQIVEFQNTGDGTVSKDSVTADQPERRGSRAA